MRHLKCHVETTVNKLHQHHYLGYVLIYTFCGSVMNDREEYGFAVRWGIALLIFHTNVSKFSRKCW